MHNNKHIYFEDLTPLLGLIALQLRTLRVIYGLIATGLLMLMAYSPDKLLVLVGHDNFSVAYWQNTKTDWWWFLVVILGSWLFIVWTGRKRL